MFPQPKMSTQRKETRKDRWMKDLEMHLSISPGVYHEMDIPGISLHSRVLFGWRRTETVVCNMSGGKKGGEDNVSSELRDWSLATPWTYMGALGVGNEDGRLWGWL